MLSSSRVDGSISNYRSHLSPVSKFSSIGGGGILTKPPRPFPSDGKPPLLPLPTNTKPYYPSSPLPIRTPNNINNKRGRRALSSSSSSPPTNKKALNISKSSTSPKKHDPKSPQECVDKRLGPEPSDIPKQVYLKGRKTSDEKEDEGDDVGGLNSIFCLAPPPSSLPLPKFFMKPKIVGCNVQADGGAIATDNLRRLLRLC